MKINNKQRYTAVSEAANYGSVSIYVSDLSLSSIWDDSEGLDIPPERIAWLSDIWHVVNESTRWLRQRSGMTQAAFAERFCIPLRTVENWEGNVSSPPVYVKLLIYDALR